MIEPYNNLLAKSGDIYDYLRMSFPDTFYRWRPHPWHGLEIGSKAPVDISVV